MTSCTFRGKEYIISKNAEKAYEEIMGRKPSESVIKVYLYSAYSGKKLYNPTTSYDDITTSDIDSAIYSDLHLYSDRKEG